MKHPKKYSSWGVIFKGEQCLFIQRSATSSRAKQWCPPGGGNEPNETPSETCLREVKEEVGLDVIVGELIMEDQGFYYFACELQERSQEIKLQSREYSNYQWVNPADFKSLGFIMELKKMEHLFKKLRSMK